MNINSRRLFILLFVCLPLITTSASAIKVSHIERSIHDGRDYSILILKIRDVEPYCRFMGDRWTFPVPKDTIIKTLYGAFQDLEEISIGKKTYKSELLKGVLWHYLYQLQIDSAYRKADSLFISLCRSDTARIEAAWFRAVNLVKRSKPVEGMMILDSLKSIRDSLPAEFWEDYTICAYMSGMRFRSMYGAEMFERMTGSEPEVKLACVAPDVAREISSDSLWESYPLGDDAIRFTSYALGLTFSVPGKWKAWSPGYRPAKSAALIDLIPDKVIHPVEKTAIETHITISIFLDDTSNLGDFVAKRIRNEADSVWETGDLRKFNAISMRLKISEMYPFCHGSYLAVIAFDREMPEHPGLMIESPMQVRFKNSEGLLLRYRPFYCRVNKRIRYLIILDACQDVKDVSEKNLQRIIESLEVD